MKRSPISSKPTQKKVNFDADYAAALPGVLMRGCEFVKYLIAYDLNFVGHREDPPGIKGWCSGPLRGHHAKGRQVADANEPKNLRCLCDYHHTFVHAHPRWSREVGLMVTRLT